MFRGRNSNIHGNRHVGSGSDVFFFCLMIAVAVFGDPVWLPRKPMLRFVQGIQFEFALRAVQNLTFKGFLIYILLYTRHSYPESVITVKTLKFRQGRFRKTNFRTKYWR